MLPTPKYKKHENVYPPSEDTFILLDALEKDFEYLYSYLLDRGIRNPLVCEIGVGSGIVSIFLNKLFEKKENEKGGMNVERLFLGIDVNKDSIHNTLFNIELNHDKRNLLMECVQMSLFQGLRPNLIVFNPPYVLTPDEEAREAQETPNLMTALSGGTNGRVIIDSLLKSINRFTSPKAVFYLVLVNENGVDHVVEEMVRMGWSWEKILYRVCGWEGLHVVKFTRNS